MDDEREPLPDTPYPFEEFEDHFDGFLDALNAEDEAFAGANGVEVEKCLFRTLMFLRDFMATREPDGLARTRNSLMICQVFDYLFDHDEALDIGAHLVKGKTTLMYSNHLIEAIFRLLYPDQVFRGMFPSPDPIDVLKLADELKRREEDHASTA